jgi:hypothetical protein
METKNETTKSDCGRWWTRPILGSDIAIDHVLEPGKYASRAPYDRRDYDGGVTSPCSPGISGWLVTEIERVENKDGREAVMLGLEWGVFPIHMNDHTNAMTWTWNDEALHEVLCREDGTPLTVCEAYGLELVEEESSAVDADAMTPDERRRHDDLVANQAARDSLFRREAQRQQRWRDGAQLRQVANEAARANVQLEDPVASDEEGQS